MNENSRYSVEKKKEDKNASVKMIKSNLMSLIANILLPDVLKHFYLS